MCWHFQILLKGLNLMYSLICLKLLPFHVINKTHSVKKQSSGPFIKYLRKKSKILTLPPSEYASVPLEPILFRVVLPSFLYCIWNDDCLYLLLEKQKRLFFVVTTYFFYLSYMETQIRNKKQRMKKI